MSRHNRQRRRKPLPPWHCLRCGASMSREASDAARAKAAREHPGLYIDLIEVCGACGTYHVRAGDGLRLATDAERFATQMETPAACELGEQLRATYFKENPQAPAFSVLQLYKRMP